MLFQKFTFLISFRVRFLDDYQAYQSHERLSSITQSNLEDVVSRFAYKNLPRVQGPHLHLSVLYTMEMYDQQLLCRKRYTFKFVKSIWQANLANTILNSLRMQTLIEFSRALILFLKWDKKIKRIPSNILSRIRICILHNSFLLPVFEEMLSEI